MNSATQIDTTANDAAINHQGQVARELYHQLNFMGDIEASSRAVAECLTLIESGDLDNIFAQATGDLNSVAQELAEGSGASLEACTHARELIQNSLSSFGAIHHILDELRQNSFQIERVARTISGIASNVHILAMNARIEAARAGEYGRGFNVVAQEMADLALNIKKESQSIDDTVQKTSKSIQHAGELASALVDDESGNNAEHDKAFETMIRVNTQVKDAGEELPEKVALLDQFLDPFEQAREAIGHNAMIQVATSNLTRNIRSIYQAIRADACDVDPLAGSLEQFTDVLCNVLVNGEDVGVEEWLAQLIEAGHCPLACLESVGKAVEAANIRQKQRHVSVGDYYLNYLVVERAIRYLQPHAKTSRSTGMTVVIGNARGDYHSLGREMVSMFLTASGIEVVDVGLGAEVRQFVDAAAHSDAKVIGVSSLLIESAKQIIKLREALDSRSMRHVKIVAGGACFTIDRDFHLEVRADYVATSASDMVNIVHRVYEYQPLGDVQP